MAAIHYQEEYIVWGILAILLGYILYNFFTGSREFFGATSNNCTWAPSTTARLPSMGVSDFLSGYEYLTSNAAQNDCGEDPRCTGIVGTTRTELITEQNGVQRNVTRTYWKMSSSTISSANTNQNIQYIAKVSCPSDNNVAPTSMCTFESVGTANTNAYGNNLNTQYKTLLEAKTACSTNPSCRGIVQKPDNFFYLSDTSRTTGMKGYRFFDKVSCPTVCSYSAGLANITASGSTFTEQYTNMTDAQVACSSNNKCMAVVKDSNDVFYMSSTKVTTGKTGYTFYEKKEDTCVSGADSGGGGRGGRGGDDNDDGGRGYDRRRGDDDDDDDERRGSRNRAIPPVGPRPGWIDSTLGRMSGEYSGMTGGDGDGDGGAGKSWSDRPGRGGDSPGDAYILKSSMVPCTCTTHSMGCERHGGGRDSSIVPGDLDGDFQYRTQSQSGLRRPFSQAFLNQGEPTGFLNSFSAFG